MPNKKALLVTTVSGFIPQFEMHNVQLLQSMGYEIHYAANYHTPSYGTDNHRLDGTGIVRHQIDFVRSPFKPANIKVFRQLYSLMKKEKFDLVHCHTPMGGVLARLAARTTRTAPVIYTAHGFHFFKGAPLINWLCYYPMEYLLSCITDQLICINKEDYTTAQNRFHAKHTDYIPGVGMDFSKLPHLTPEEIKAKKEALHLPLEKTLLLSSGELIKRKNHKTILRSLAKLRDANPQQFQNIHYVHCGHGELSAYLQEIVQQLDLSDMVTFAGYREDMAEIYQIADIFLFPSYQEGLPMSLLEAMASRLPVICSDIRGNCDLMGDAQAESKYLKRCAGGIVVKKADDADAFAHAIELMVSAPQKLPLLAQANYQRSQEFHRDCVKKRMKQIYDQVL